MTKRKILLTCPPMLRAVKHFEARFAEEGLDVHCPNVVQILSEPELKELLPQFEGWIIGDDPATRDVFEAGHRGNLKAAVKWGVGVDNVDFQAAKDLNIPITNTPGMFGAEVADIAHAYLIGLARETYLIDRHVRQGEWPKPTGISLKSKQLGLIGFGDIGKNVAKRALASDMDIIAYDPYFNPDPNLKVSEEVWPNRIEECDFLVFTCALTPKNQHMLNSEIFGRLKPGVRIVNVARGPLIDEAALIQNLESGRVHSAALDVMENEPLPANSALRKFERCIFGSHNASNTIDAVVATSHKAIDHLVEFLKEETEQ